eukprot:GHVN01008325.1.p1 GENE.GHVN01008325.1~~GHVN01008325.1.p1  ORF type:complete len:328 (-),score=69.28 GHVN01008325.1:188-1171(-)
MYSTIMRRFTSLTTGISVLPKPITRTTLLHTATTPLTTVETLSVVGAGQMGTGIAIAAARDADLKVNLYDSSQPQLDKSKRFIDRFFESEVSKGRLSKDDGSAFTSLITLHLLTDDLSSHSPLSESHYVIEAAVECVEVKRNIFAQLDKVTPTEVVLASNTSSISISKIASATSRPEKVIGMHFMNPVPKMPLVELIRGIATSQETVDTTQTLVKRMGKEGAMSLDRPGFIANRVLMPYINEAIFCLQEGTASAEDIDKIMKLGTNVPMGPLTLADFIGLDTCLSIMRVLHKEIGDSKYRPATLLTQYVDAGWTGRKAGRGFYDYRT